MVAAGFLLLGVKHPHMESIRKGLRAGDLEKDVYERLNCTECGEQLATENDPDEIGTVRVCPECGTKWKQVG
jgi:DNA-directed RNA polymerase subunit RPC12/RpoP